MNILIVANHWAVCSARYATDAFTRLGHTVRHVGPAMGRNIWGMQVPEEYVWTPDWNMKELRGRDFHEQLFGNNDVIIVMDSDPAILDEWNIPFKNEAHNPIIVWGVDNHVRDYRRPYFDHYFLAHQSVSVMDWRTWKEVWSDGSDWSGYDENDDMTWLPCAYDPVAFPPSPIPWNDRQYDVCMIGMMYPKRWELVNAMRAAGLKVLAGTGLIYDAYRDAYHNSRVALVSSFNGDLPIRLFEGAGMGCAVLHDAIADFDPVLKTAIDAELDPAFMEYTSADDAVELALRMQDEGWGISAQDSLQWAANHTWDKRAQVIIDWMATR